MSKLYLCSTGVPSSSFVGYITTGNCFKANYPQELMHSVIIIVGGDNSTAK